MKLSRERQGDLFIVSAALLWGFFPVITVLSYNTISPLISLTISSLFSTIFFAGIITVKKSWHQLQVTSAYKDILLTTIILGIIYYLLVFFGLQSTSPGNAAIVSLTQIFFSFLFFHVFRRDHIPRVHIYGAILMIIGAFIVLAPNFKTFHGGDMVILLANAIAPFGNFFAQKARKKINSETLMFIRSILSTCVFFFLIIFLHSPLSFQALQNSFWFLAINGFLLFGLNKLLWIDGIHRISVTKANALESSIVPLITLLSAWLLLQQHPTIWQLFSLLPICMGVVLLGKKQKEEAATI